MKGSSAFCRVGTYLIAKLCFPWCRIHKYRLPSAFMYVLICVSINIDTLLRPTALRPLPSRVGVSLLVKLPFRLLPTVFRQVENNARQSFS